MTTKLFAGFPSRSDAKISSMKAKQEANKTQTSIMPGDVLTLEVVDGTTYVKKITKTDVGCCVYGVAVIGISQYIVPVLISGHIIANPDSAVFPTLTVGEHLKCPKNGSKPECLCCNTIVVRKLKGIKDDSEIDCYELKIS